MTLTGSPRRSYTRLADHPVATAGVLTLLAAAMCVWTLHFTVEVMKMIATPKTAVGKLLPDYCYVIGLATALGGAAVITGLLAALAAPRHAITYAVATFALGLSGLVALLLVGLPWLEPVRYVSTGAWTWTLPIAALGLAGLTSWLASRQPGQRSPNALETDLHLAVLVAVWVIGGFVTNCTPQEVLILLGALVFALHTYPRLPNHPQWRVTGNLPILILGAWLLLLQLRDLPVLLYLRRLTDIAVRDTTCPRVGSFMGFTHHATFLDIIAISILAAGALALALSAFLPPRAAAHRAAWQWGGGAMLLCALLVPQMALLMFLPMGVLLFLYTYHLFANGADLRRFLWWVVVALTWVPVVALWQYGQKYLAAAATSHRLPSWYVYKVGDDHPFMWHDCLGTSICVMLPLIYALIRFAPSRGARRYLHVMLWLLGLTLILTFARGAWLACVVTCVTGAMWIGGRRYRWLPIAALALAVALVFASITGSIHPERILGREASTRSRLLTAQTAWQITKQHPAFGIAPLEWNLQCARRNSPEVRGYYKGGVILGWLQVPLQGGVVGCAIVLLAISWLVRKIKRTLRAAENERTRLHYQCITLSLIALGVTNCFDVVLWEEGRILAPVLLGAMLGSAWASRAPLTASPVEATSATVA